MMRQINPENMINRTVKNIIDTTPNVLIILFTDNIFVVFKAIDDGENICLEGVELDILDFPERELVRHGLCQPGDRDKKIKEITEKQEKVRLNSLHQQYLELKKIFESK